MNIYIEFTRPKSKLAFYSHLTRLVQQTPYSHVRFKYQNWAGAWVICEASRGSVRRVGSVYQKENPQHVLKCYRIKLNAQQAHRFLKYIDKWQGVKYSWLQAIGIGVKNIFNNTRNTLRNDHRQQICSEYVARVLAITLNTQMFKDVESVGPRGVEQALIKAGYICQ